jgi:hypothetical protein|tara:strand:- start:15863 stop:16867 length:1005 start_codon:yes stop_codon:yes gene_type:complete
MSDKKNKMSSEEAKMARALEAKDGINNPQVESNAPAAQDIESAVDAAGLGRVNMANFTPDKAQSADSALGWHVLDQMTLPSEGKFYPADCIIKIRSAKAAEIRHFSTMDENNYIDMEDKLNSVVESCSQVTSGAKRLSYKDVLEEDRIVLLLSIRDLTFPEPENKLMLNGKGEKTKKKFEVELTTKNLVPSTIDEEIERYYDSKERTYVIKTRSAGEIRMHPPTIGVMQEVTQYLKDRNEKELEFDKAFIQVLPYIQNDWRTLSLTRIFQLEIDYKAWDQKKFMIIYRLAERMRIGVQANLETTVDGETVKAPLEFPGGIKSLFIISDLAGELL